MMRALVAAAVMWTASMAQADPCTPSGTITGTLDAGASTPGLLGPTYAIDAVWSESYTINAQGTCENVSQDYTVGYVPVSIPDGGAYLENTMGYTPSGTASLEADSAGQFLMLANFQCVCGGRGGGGGTWVTGNTVLVPPTIPEVVLLPSLGSRNWNGRLDDIPVGAVFSIDTSVSAVLCPGDTLSFSVSGAGVDYTYAVPVVTSCTEDSYSPPTTDTISPTSPGAMTLTATFDGSVSNAIAMTVVADSSSCGSTGGSTGSHGSTGGTSGSSTTAAPKVGCAAAPGAPLILACLASLGFGRRRRA